MNRAALSLLGLVLLGTGCERRNHLASPDTVDVLPKPVAPARSAYLSVSDLSPTEGAVIVVAGTVTVGSDLSLGSFRVRLRYDSTLLHLIGEVPASGMMRVVNPQPGEVVIVGASSASSADGRLFTLRFRVDSPAGLNSLMLVIDELNDAAFLEQKRTIVRASRLLRDSTLAGGQAVP